MNTWRGARDPFDSPLGFARGFGKSRAGSSLRLKNGYAQNDAFWELTLAETNSRHLSETEFLSCVICPLGCAEFLAGVGAVSVKEVAGGHALLTFQLDFEEFERAVVAAAD